MTIPGLSSAAPTPVWSYTVVSPSVPQGSNLLIAVEGAPNGSYFVSLNPEPFNFSLPVFAESYKLPLVATLPNDTAVGEVSVNTSLFAPAGYQLSITGSSGGLIGTTELVQVTTASDTALVNRVNQLSFDLGVNATRVNGLLYLRDQVWSWCIFAVAWSTVWTVALLYLVLATRTSARERRLIEKSLDIGHGIIHQPRSQTFSGAWEIQKKGKPADPRAVFVLKPPICEVCEMPGVYAQAEAHGRAHPNSGQVIVASPRATAFVRESMRVHRDSTKPSHAGKSERREPPLRLST